MKRKLLSVIIFAALIMSVLMPSALAEGTVAAVVTKGTEQQEFKSVKEAFNYAVKERKIETIVTLMTDWNLGSEGIAAEGYAIPDSAKLYIDLNGFKLDARKAKGRIFHLNENASLTIKDSNKESDNYNSIIKGGVLVGGMTDDHGGAIYLEDNATLKMTDCSIVGCVSDDDGGAIYAEENVKVELVGTRFYTNRSFDGEGGAIYSDDSRVTLKNCVFEGNYSKGDGGAVYLNSDEAASVTGCTFLYNKSSGHGGAVYANGSGGTTLRNNTIKENRCAVDGGGIYVHTDRVYVMDNTIINNNASDDGGGIYVDSMYDINCCGQLVVENNKDSDGNSDLCLQIGVASTAYMNCGGFTEGAHVGIDLADDNESVICKDISIFQFKNYLFADRGNLKFTKEKTVAENFVSSAIGSGSMRMIIIGAVVLVVFSFVVPYSIKKRRRSEDDENNKKEADSEKD